MKKNRTIALGFALALALINPAAFGRDTSDTRDARLRPMEGYSGSHGYSLDRDIEGEPLRALAPGDTYILADYSFDSGPSCVVEGWTSFDLTAQLADFFHVAQATGGVNNELNGGGFGRLVPLEGNKSLWCGAWNDYPTTPPGTMCGYAAMPGYGNDWNQGFCTKACLAVGTDVTMTFLVSWDTEPGYDGITIEVDRCDDTWMVAGPVMSPGGHFDGTGVDSLHTHSIPDSLHSGSIRIRIHFQSDIAWSDQDGLWDTDGAILIDSLSVSDNGGLVLSPDTFEDEVEGQTTSNDWENCAVPGYGDFSGLFHGFNVIQEDPCYSEITCLWGWFNGSPANYACGGFPGQPAMPYGNELGQFLNNAARSPEIPWVGAGAYAELEFSYYRDTPLDNLQFLTWGIASRVGTCLGPFRDRNFVYYGGQKDWVRPSVPVGDLIAIGTTHVVVQLGVRDMCSVWCGIYGSGACHSHAPLVDGLVVRRIETVGPQWSVNAIGLFQDTFATDGTINPTSTGRADMANDVNPSSDPAILPRDDIAVTVNDPANGLAADPYTGFGSAVYAHVSVWPQGQTSKEGGALTQNTQRYPVVDNFIDLEGTHWFTLRMDTNFSDADARTGPWPGEFSLDLNDNLFTVGDTVCFAFSAKSAGTGDVTWFSPFTGGTLDRQEALTTPAEFQILPGGGHNNGGDILYVDGMDGRGAQQFFDTAFDLLGIRDQVDRYDIRGPSSLVGNGPGSRVVNVFNQIIAPYRRIIWNTGDLSVGLIGDGTGNPEKSDDAFVLFTFLDQSPSPVGIYFSGDDIADELYNKPAPGASLLQLRGYITGAVNAGDTDARGAGYGTAPLVVGEPGSCFDHILGADQAIAYGGCPLVNDFDVITPTGTAQLEMNYGGTPGQSKGAIISQVTNNAAGVDVGVILSGFSFHYMRDAAPASVPARVHHLEDILTWLGTAPPVPTEVTPAAYTNSLSQNYPNPFNPVTSITFTVRERTPVTLRVYNVAGQLVRTLVAGVRGPGAVHTIEWDGRSDAGETVSSGVYFYRLATKEFTQTRKMVLLK